jgi:acyl carrier protein
VSIQAEIESRVIGVIRHELHAVDRRIDARTRLDQLGADSLALIKLTLTFEEAFNIESLMKKRTGFGPSRTRSRPWRGTSRRGGPRGAIPKR